MPPTIQLADPPREIPLGLQLKLLASRDVTGSLLYFVPAAAALIGAAYRPEIAAKIALISIGAVFLVLGLRTALPALVRAMRTLGRMRYGFLTLGRIVSCRLAWDRKRAEMPYAEFLSNWAVNVGKSQMGKGIGCLSSIVVAVFVVPFVLMMLIAATALVMKLLHVPLGDAVAGEVDAPFLAQWIAMVVFVVAVTLLYLHYNRRQWVKAVEPYMEWRRLAQPGKDDVYDEDAMRLVESAKERGVQISLKEPLPENYSGVELICRAEYSVRGERCTGEGRVRLSNRLDPAGVERLLFHPVRREKVIFFAGLPEEVRVDTRGQWESVPAVGPAVALALTGLVAGAALVGFGLHVPGMMAIFR